MTAYAWGEWCRQQWPGLSDADVSTLLWQCTAYPLGTIDEVEAEFVAMRDRAGGDFVRALELVDESREERL